MEVENPKADKRIGTRKRACSGASSGSRRQGCPKAEGRCTRLAFAFHANVISMRKASRPTWYHAFNLSADARI